MIIANPISDLAFKWLMDKQPIAKYFIESILEETVEDLQMMPQEMPYEKKDPNTLTPFAFAIFRLDFVATIKTSTGEYKKVLIEMQKARHQTDIMRFRNYLASHYMRKDTVQTDSGKKKMALPIITIYFLGFKLNEIPTPVLKVNRVYTDQIKHEEIIKKDEFIEKLTHDCFVVQIPRIDGQMHSQLEQALSFFEQKYYTDETGMYKDYPYAVENEYQKMIVEELNYASHNLERRKKLDLERELMREWYSLQEEQEERMQEVKKELQAEKKELQRAKKEIATTKKEMNKKDKEMNRKDKEMNKKEKEIAEMKKELDELKRRLG